MPGLNETPASERVHIAFFGRTNTGKSSLVNAVTGQDLAVVSEIKGTTTDPVFKSMELLPLGPVLIIDTPGIDDTGSLGELRVRKAKQVLNRTDVAVLVADSTVGLTETENSLIRFFTAKKVPWIIAWNKDDLTAAPPLSGNEGALTDFQTEGISVSAKTGHHIDKLKEKIAALSKNDEPKFRIVGDLVHPGDFVVLVTPIDKAAPRGRLILPQQQTIRDVLESDAVAVVVKEYELREALEHLGKKPRLVVTDSQVFAKVSADTPTDIPLTSFSILFARYKGFLDASVRGVAALETIGDGDRVLICEGCTHHRQCDDIGTIKLPRWIKSYTGKNPEFVWTSGGDFPEDLSSYKMIIHCGACMLTEREMRYRCECAADQNIPWTNYGVLIAHIQGILRRSISMFPSLVDALAERTEADV